MQRVLAAATLCLMIATIPATSFARADAPVRIGAIYLDAQGYYAGVRKGVEEGATAAGRPVKLIETNSGDDPSRESQFIDTLIEAPVRAILLSAVSAQGSVHAAKRAHAAGIPVVCYNTCIDDADATKYVAAYVIGDPEQFGRELGEAAVRYFRAAKKATPSVAVVNCEFVEVCIARRKGFVAALQAELPGARIVDNQQGTTADAALQVALRMITAHPALDAFFTESGGATVGAVRAVKTDGRPIVVFGSDMTSDTAQALKQHAILKAVADISGIVVGKLAIANALAAIDGTVKGDKVVDAPVVLYATATDATRWTATHPDGLP